MHADYEDTLEVRLQRVEGAVEEIRATLARLEAASVSAGPRAPQATVPLSATHRAVPIPPPPAPLEQVFCPNCHGGNPPTAQVCMWCGRPLPAAAPTPGLSESTLAIPAKPLDAARQSAFWLNKIGIGLFLLGLAFFFKYSIDQGWLGPWVRVIIGLAFGTILLAFGLRLIGNHRHFGQVLLGGGIAAYYITGFASFQLLNLVPYPVAFAFMAATTIFAFFLSIGFDAVPLALIAVIGGLATPLVLNTGERNITALVGYTLLLLAGATAIFMFKGWRSLLWSAFVGGWAVLLIPAVLALSQSERWTLEAGAIFMLLAFWILPVLRDLLSMENPARWPRPELDIFESVVSPDWRDSMDLSVHLLTFLTPFAVIGYSVGLDWPGSNGDVWGFISLAGAAVFGVLAWSLNNRQKQLAYTHALTAVALFTLGISLILEGDVLFVALALEAALLQATARRRQDIRIEWIANTGWLLLVIWLAARLAYPYATELAVFNAYSLSNLAIILLLGGMSWVVRTQQVVWLYRIGAHIGFLWWLWRELERLPSGNALVTVAWSIYALAILGVGSWLKGTNRLPIMNIGIATLFLVVGKLILVDLVVLDAVWRILLFLGVGALLLVLSYYLPMNRKEKS